MELKMQKNPKKEKQSSFWNNVFNNEDEFQNHLNFIKEEEKKLDFENRTHEVRNWLNHIKVH